MALYCIAAVLIAVANRPLFSLINGAHNEMADRFFGLVSGLGDGLIVAMVSLGCMLWRLRLGAAALAAFALSGLIAQAAKFAVDVPRPPAVMADVHVLGASLSAHSFPSGHATSLGVLLALLFIVYNRRDPRLWLLAILVLLAAYGRIYGGVHFPLDVWAGLGIGAACMVLVWRRLSILPTQPWEASPRVWQLPALALACLAMVLGLGYGMQPATAQPLAPLAAILSLVWLMWRWRKLGNKSLF